MIVASYFSDRKLVSIFGNTTRPFQLEAIVHELAYTYTSIYNIFIVRTNYYRLINDS